MNIYIYDIEVFSDDWIVDFSRPELDAPHITIHNDNADGDVKTGILEFGKPYWGFNTDEYSLTRNNDPDVYFRKSHVKSIKEARE